MQYVTLKNGVKMPQLGYGVWKISDQDAVKSVGQALKIGYRSIDTATLYENERGVGEAIKETDITREELFITTKVWDTDHGYENTLKAFDTSVEKLGLDYVDLYLVHWPQSGYIETYKALEKLYKDGRVKAIGVSNFTIEHLERLMDECEIVPVVNQVECHPFLQQRELKEFCEKHDIVIEAWSPLMRAGEILNNEVIKEIAHNNGKTPAQIILRWHLQYGNIVIPKSATLSRMEENFQVFDFELSDNEMKLIKNLNRNERNGFNPEEIPVF